jgi:hypothetical protein
MIPAAILTAEAAFWLVLLGGLTARYALGRPRLGAALLVGVPLLVRAADRRFARRFAGGRAPATSPPAVDRLAAHWRLWLRGVLAGGLAAAVLGALVLVGGPADTRALWAGGGCSPSSR